MANRQLRTVGVIAGLTLVTCVVAWHGSQQVSPAMSALVGDANCNGRVDPIDAAVILQYDAGLISSLPCMGNADVNGDVTVGPIDAALILQYDAGLIDSLPPGGSHPTARPPSPTPRPTATPTSTAPQPPTATMPPTPTPSATATMQEPTFTPPQVTPTHTATPGEGGVITRNSSWYETAGLVGNALEVVGEVYNGLEHEVAYVEITADLYSSSDTLVGTESGSACVTAIPAHSDSPFTVLIFDPPPGVDHLELRVTDFLEPPFLFADPPVVGVDVAVTNVYTDAMDYRHVVGTATNNSANTYEYVNVCVASYDAAGNVVRTGNAYTQPDTLGPVATGTFDASVHAGGAGIVSERTWVDAAYADSAPSVGSLDIRNSSWYETAGLVGNALEVVGEVYNGLEHEVAYVEITADLYSSSDTLVGTESGSACVTAIPAHSDSPFTVLIFDPPPGVDHLVLRVTDFLEPPFLFADPPVVGLDATVTNLYTDIIDYRHVVGVVTNNSANNYQYVGVCVASYDQAGNVVRTGATSTLPDTLGPGQTGTFEALVDAAGVTIVSDRLWVDASYAD